MGANEATSFIEDQKRKSSSLKKKTKKKTRISQIVQFAS